MGGIFKPAAAGGDYSIVSKNFTSMTAVAPSVIGNVFSLPTTAGLVAATSTLVARAIVQFTSAFPALYNPGALTVNWLTQTFTGASSTFPAQGFLSPLIDGFAEIVVTVVNRNAANSNFTSVLVYPYMNQSSGGWPPAQPQFAGLTTFNTALAGTFVVSLANTDQGTYQTIYREIAIISE